MIRRATVLGDRFGKIDARTMDNPTFEFFLPHVQMLRAGAHTTVDTSSATETGADESGDTEWNRERRARTIFAEEIKGELESAGKSGQSAADKKERGDLLHEIFGTRSWTAIENLHSQRLRTGLDKLRVRLGTAPPDLPDEGEQKSADTEGTT